MKKKKKNRLQIFLHGNNISLETKGIDVTPNSHGRKTETGMNWTAKPVRQREEKWWKISVLVRIEFGKNSHSILLNRMLE